MPLKIQLRKGQKIIINGAVLENAGAHTASLLVKNDAAIMRDTDILTFEDAKTPASRVYYSVQCLYLFPTEREKHLQNFNELVGSYCAAAPSSKPICEGIRGLVNEGKFYQALKSAQDLIAHEKRVLAYVHGTIGQQVQRAAAGGESPGDGSVGPDAGGPQDEGRSTE
ncbi:MAG: flagellar biosynthesis repressor FlbT [Rhodospirillales bacterium]|jgi:flagellar protein FlbT|nr:flagellar biosynthesis repressor FlbT [Rhodospirillales bacterium]